jgi:hypothetical protein
LPGAAVGQAGPGHGGFPGADVGGEPAEQVAERGQVGVGRARPQPGVEGDRGLLQVFGTHQPIDALVNAERALILGGPAAHDVLISLAWSGGLLVVFALLAARIYARMGR